MRKIGENVFYYDSEKQRLTASKVFSIKKETYEDKEGEQIKSIRYGIEQTTGTFTTGVKPEDLFSSKEKFISVAIN